MAGWSKVADESSLNRFKTIHKVQSFYQFLSIFLKEINGINCFSPLPPILGTGQSLDLLKLYLIVREKGGYEKVSKNGLWGLVGKDCGFDSGVGLAVKLVYNKYLDTFDRWLHSVDKDKDLVFGLKDCGVGLDSFSMDLESNIKGLLVEFSDQKKKDGEYLHVDLKKNEMDFTGVENLGNGGGVWSFVGCNGCKVSNGYEKGGVDLVKDDVVVDSNVGKEDDFDDRKKKLECCLETLDWVTEVAKDPCDMSIGSLPELSKWKCYGNEMSWKQVLLAREAMFLKRSFDSSDDQSIWQKQKMHPTMYDYRAGSERLRCRRRIPFAKESQAQQSSCKKLKAQTFSESSSSGIQSDKEDSDLLTADSLWDNYDSEKKIPIGPYFQAKVPEWTEETHESDTKWLGTRVWPLEKEEQNKYLIERDRIGKGRQDACGCQFSGSLDCVRFHLTGKRMKVKLELGTAFHRWKFNKMGEEGALSWTKEEENKFQVIVQSNSPSLGKCFWDEMFQVFPSKRREELVSYYFNVFLLRRRAYQNRSCSSNIDSDDDELEFASSSKGKSPSSILYSPKKTHFK